jgi:transposase-like protein
MKYPKTLQQAIQYFTDPENCREFMVAMRWPDGKITCPTCGKENPAWIASAKVYYCTGKHPKQKFSLKVGTILEDSPIGLDKWFPAMWLICNAKNGTSSYEMARALGVTQKTAWFMLHRIRTAMQNRTFLKLGGSEGGPVEVDEVFIGPNPERMHRSRRLKMQKAINQRTHKVAVMGMLDRETRQVRTKVIPDVSRKTLQEEILRQIDTKSTIYTDNFSG